MLGNAALFLFGLLPLLLLIITRLKGGVVKNKFNYMRFYFALLWTLLLLFLTGCWSSKEVEELSLTAGIALDKGKNSTIEKEDEEGGYPKRNLITATYQIVSSQAQSKGNGQQNVILMFLRQVIPFIKLFVSFH